MSCINKLAINYVKDCSYRPVTGIVARYLINLDDIDRVASQVNTTNTMVTDLILKSGAKIYEIGGDIKSLKASYELVKGDYFNGYKHICETSLHYVGLEERELINQLTSEARVVVINKKRDTGITGEETFEIFGWRVGLEIESGTRNYGENAGVYNFILASKDGEVEPYTPLRYLESDATTTETKIKTNLFTR